MTLTAADIERLRALTDPISLAEAEEIYLPLSRLISFYVEAAQAVHRVSTRFLGAEDRKVPFIIGVAGLGRLGQVDHLAHPARAAAALAHLAEGRPRHHRRLSATRTPICEKRGIADRKGFPESYDRARADRVPLRHQVRQARRQGAGLFAPHLRRAAGRVRHRRPARHPHRRGAQYPAAGRAAEVRQADPLRLGFHRFFDLSSTPTKPICGTGSWCASGRCAKAPSPTPRAFSAASPKCPTPRPKRFGLAAWDGINLPNLRRKHPADPRPRRPDPEKSGNHAVEEVRCGGCRDVALIRDHLPSREKAQLTGIAVHAFAVERPKAARAAAARRPTHARAPSAADRASAARRYGEITSLAARHPRLSAVCRSRPRASAEQEPRGKEVAGAGRVDHRGRPDRPARVTISPFVDRHRALGAHGDRRELAVLGELLHRVVQAVGLGRAPSASSTLAKT